MTTATPHAWLRRVSDYHSGGVSTSERAAVEAHLSTCAECRLALAAYRRLYTLARSPLRLDDGGEGPLMEYQPLLLEETMLTTDRDTRNTATRTSRRTALTALGAIAAVLLIALLAGTLFTYFQGRSHPVAPPHPRATKYQTREFRLPTANSNPRGITAGPDGAIWFTELSHNQIGRITTDGQIREFPLPEARSGPETITVGPDHALWFTEHDGNRIGRITTDGQFREFPLPKAGSAPVAITTGPDGALWFTEVGDIGRITTDGQLREFPITNLPEYAAIALVVGADHALWFSVNTPANDNEIWRMTTDGQISKFAPNSTDHVISYMALGPDGAYWYTETAANVVGRLTVSP
jgi:streptogramin lyase